MRNQTGSSLIETVVALALLGVISVAFLGAIATASGSRLVADEHASARVLAESQMENIKKQTYAFSYDPVPIPAEYVGYSADIDVDNMRNGHIQKITVTINHHGKDITELEDYKVNR